MIPKSPSIQTRMTSQGIWCLEGTPGILEVYNLVDSQPEDQGDDSNHKRAEVATKLLETLENFNYDETEPTDSYISDWLSGEETSVELPSIFEDIASLPPPPPTASLAPTGPSGAGGFYNARGIVSAGGASQWSAANKKVGYEWSAAADDYPSSLYSPALSQTTPWPQYVQGVPNQLTPPCSPPTMYEASPRRPAPVEFEDLADDLLKPAADPSMKEETALLSLLAEMNPKDLDEFVVRSAEENFGIQASDGFSPELERSFIVPPDIPLSPEHSCSSDSFGYHSESDHSSSSDADYNPSSPEVARKTPKLAAEPSRTTTPASKAKVRVTGARAQKPYARKPVPVEDRKLRKKEQNKNAATRYRIKKKAEIEVILGEEAELQEHHEALQTKLEDLNREVRFMKKFMRDFFKTQGVLK